MTAIAVIGYLVITRMLVAFMFGLLGEVEPTPRGLFFAFAEGDPPLALILVFLEVFFIMTICVALLYAVVAPALFLAGKIRSALGLD